MNLTIYTEKTLLEIGNAGTLNLKISGITTVPNFKNFQSSLFF